MGKDFYRTLGISKTANDDEIKEAYKKLALKYHPEKNKEEDAEDKFREISEAYEVLSDKNERENYDRFGEDGIKGSGYGGSMNNGRSSSGSQDAIHKSDPFKTFNTFFQQSHPPRNCSYGQDGPKVQDDTLTNGSCASGSQDKVDPFKTSNEAPANQPNRPKLFVRPAVKSNHIIIQNALMKVLEGAVNAELLKKMQTSLNANLESCEHFLILFRNRLQFRGLYKYDEKQDVICKLDGIGPKSLTNEDIFKYYKFDSPRREFMEVQTKHISLTIIAFTIHDHLWPKKRNQHQCVQNNNR